MRLRCQRQGLQLLVAEGRQCVWFGSQNVYVFQGDGFRATKQYLLVCFCYYAADSSQENRSSQGVPLNSFYATRISQTFSARLSHPNMSLYVGPVVWFQPDSISQVPWVDLILSRVSADMSSPHSMASGSAESDSVTCVQTPRQRRDPTQ